MFMLKAVEETAERTREKILAITELMESATKFVQAQLPKLYSHELIQAIFQQPYCRISKLVDTGIAKRQTAWILWGEQAFEVWRNGELSERVYGELERIQYE